jgi:hypothetical protein
MNIYEALKEYFRAFLFSGFRQFYKRIPEYLEDFQDIISEIRGYLYSQNTDYINPSSIRSWMWITPVSSLFEETRS